MQTTTPIPTTVLTGFLGAGKTTLLNRILAEPGAGRVRRDRQRIRRSRASTGSSRCRPPRPSSRSTMAACAARCAATSSRRSAGSSRPVIAFDRVVIETSGLADPAPVIQSFVLDEVLRARFALDAIVTVVDARHLAHATRP